MQAMLGHSGRSPIVLTIFAGSAASCSGVKAMHLAAPVLAEVSFKWAKRSGTSSSKEGSWLNSKGQTVWPVRQARRIVKINSAFWPEANTTRSFDWGDFDNASS